MGESGSERHRGECFCGAVVLEIAGEPLDMGYCHCASCRSYSGAPLIGFMIWPADKVKITGSLGSYNKVGTSDRKFCLRCGGHLLLDHPDLGVVDVRAAVLPSVEFEPRSHLNYAERVMSIQDGLPKFRDMPVAIGGTGEVLAD